MTTIKIGDTVRALSSGLVGRVTSIYSPGARPAYRIAGGDMRRVTRVAFVRSYHLDSVLVHLDRIAVKLAEGDVETARRRLEYAANHLADAIGEGRDTDDELTAARGRLAGMRTQVSAAAAVPADLTAEAMKAHEPLMRRLDADLSRRELARRIDSAVASTWTAVDAGADPLDMPDPLDDARAIAAEMSDKVQAVQDVVAKWAHAQMDASTALGVINRVVNA